jgi:LPXTG-motif cell wall-anchored protein
MNYKERPHHRRRFALTALFALVLAMAPVMLGATAAHAAGPFHGITLQKFCTSPTPVGDQMQCSFKVTNADDNNENIVITSLTDVVHSAGGNVSSGNILGTLVWTPTGGASCGGGTCTLPNKDDSIESNLFSHYTVQAADYNITTDHILADQVTVGWSEPVCELQGCPVGPQSNTTGASTTVTIATPSVTTKLSADAVQVGTSVTDQATLVGATSDAGGNVSYAVFDNNECSGDPVADLGTKTVTDGAVGPSDPWSAGPAGDFWFQATYSGDDTNAGPVTSPCTSEPITVTNTPPVTIAGETTTTVAETPATITPQAELPRTGGSTGPQLWIAFAVLMLGGALWLFGTRFRRRTS